jgi:16S rRNA (cytidine1402-2'-O)-methyltransferase
VPGALFVVATPIGNLEDFTFRGLRTLREVDLIAAEDTRRTSKLLAHYEVRKPLVSLREHNEGRETPRLIARLQAGASIALVSDAGTPGISDPGARLVRAVRGAGLRVVPIPGPSAITAALSASGIEASSFAFLGFPPPTGIGRDRWFDALAGERRLSVFFEAPHRILRTLEDCQINLVKRQIIVWRELSKLNEESVEHPNKLAKEAGEFTVVVAPSLEVPGHAGRDLVSAEQIQILVGCLTEKIGVDREVAMTMAARAFLLTPRKAASMLKKHEYSVKRQSEPEP